MKINQPGGHLDQMMRQTRAHLVQLSTMADMKANMLLTMSSVVATLCLPQMFTRTIQWPLLLLVGFCLLTILLATYAVMPKLPISNKSAVRPDIQSPTFNLLFFGDFTRLSYGEFESAMEENMNDSSRTYQIMVREVYTLGVFLAKKKYRYLRLAYLSFITGLFASFIGFVCVALFD
jgi:Family of unknown function (DUF5706)